VPLVSTSYAAASSPKKCIRCATKGKSKVKVAKKSSPSKGMASGKGTASRSK
jgi:hypothetical protein